MYGSVTVVTVLYGSVTVVTVLYGCVTDFDYICTAV